jgi:hypothetical protein
LCGANVWAIETGAARVDAARRLGDETLDWAKSATGKLSIWIAERALRRPLPSAVELRDAAGRREAARQRADTARRRADAALRRAEASEIRGRRRRGAA